MRRQHLEVLNARTSIAVVVLDAHIRELHVFFTHRQPIGHGPFRNLICVAVRTAIAISTAAIGLLEKPLIGTLQLVVQNDAADPSATGDQTLRCAAVGAIQVSVVRQLAWLTDTCVERLGGVALMVAACVLEDVSTSLSECHERRPRPSDHVRHRSHQPKVAKMSEVA
jgi:hypothetical protein